MLTDRRSSARYSLEVFFNKFLDGHPYLCRAVDISRDGILCDVFTEPATRHESFPIELRLPGQSANRSLWVWGRKVRTTGPGAGAESSGSSGSSPKRVAIRFLSLHEDDRASLDEYLDALAACAA